MCCTGGTERGPYHIHALASGTEEPLGRFPAVSVATET